MSGATTGTVRSVLRLEGLCVLVASVAFYAKFGLGWGLFASCFLVPDLSFLGYLAGARWGSIAYNAAHSYVGAVACLCAASITSSPILLAAGLIWCAHIGFDRALGYGLKYSHGFAVTHLGLIGRAGQEAPNPSVKGTSRKRAAPYVER
jgi:hypothetical protein